MISDWTVICDTSSDKACDNLHGKTSDDDRDVDSVKEDHDDDTEEAWANNDSVANDEDISGPDCVDSR